MIKELLQEGFLLKSKGYYKHAIEAFYKALEIDNSSSELLLEIAELYYLMRDEERALHYIEQILNKEPAHIESLKLLERIFKEKGALEEAEQTAKNIYCFSGTLENLADIFRILNLENKYDEIFEYSVENPDGRILYEQAYAKYMKNECDKAEELINKALEKENNNNYMLLKGEILFRAGKRDECTSFFEKIKIDKNNPESLNFAGLVKQHEGEFKSAIGYFKSASKLEPENDLYYYNIASTYFKLDDIQQAKKYYNLAIAHNPENQNYHFALANLYYSEKHYKRAMEELTGDFFEARLLKSIILYDTGYLAIAKRELEELNREFPENFIVQDYRKRIEEELKV